MVAPADLIETLPKTATDNTVTVIRGAQRGPLKTAAEFGGYEELLQIITDPIDELFGEYTGWVPAMTNAPVASFDPAEFDEKASNRALRKQFPRRPPRVR